MHSCQQGMVHDYIIWVLSSVVEPETRAEEPMKLPPGAGAEITNCGFGSGSLSIYHRLELIL
jgi:hypothetical protein